MEKKSIDIKKLQGFTLIELIVVIVIIGILSAVAVPRFMSQTKAARIAALNGFAGNLNSAAALVQQQYLADGFNTSNTTTTLTMNGILVSVIASTGAPAATAMNVVGNATTAGGALSNWSGFSITTAAGTATVNLPTALTNCSAIYTDGGTAGQPSVAVTTSGC